ncbi:serine--tRNA ligase [Patescibacteria group bacterium]
MLDIKFIRQNPKEVKEGCKKKQVKVDIDKILALDQKKREYLQKKEGLKSKQNKLGKDEIKEAKKLKAEIKKIEPKLKEIEKELQNLLLHVPNLPQDDVPVGKDEKDNVVLEKIGKETNFSFKPKDYMEIGESLDLIDVKKAAKTSGTRFGFLKREAALLEFAIICFAFEKLIKKGFIPVVPPVMLKSEMAKGMGYLEQADANEAYYLPQDDLYLIATSEQSLGTMHANEIFQEKDLPRRYAGFSTCFRREAGSYGKDTKGIFRVHQFDKVEMFSFSKPEESKKEHKFFMEIEKELMKDLKIPYQIVQICSGDLGFPVANKYDIEAWIPSEGCYRETHSCSNCTDFQARRLNIRYRKKDNQLNFVHTVNGTALAIGRTLIAIIENYQQKDGSVLVPEVLQKYFKFKKIPSRK